MKKMNPDSESDSLVIDKLSMNRFEQLKAKRDAIKKEIQSEKVSNPSAISASDVSKWQKSSAVFPETQKPLIANAIPASDLMIFELDSDHSALKVQWSGLAPRLKEVFEEIAYSLPVHGLPKQNGDGCYTFSYSDDEYNLSVISIVIEGKAALFYKNAEPSAS